MKGYQGSMEFPREEQRLHSANTEDTQPEDQGLHPAKENSWKDGSASCRGSRERRARAPCGRGGKAWGHAQGLT